MNFLYKIHPFVSYAVFGTIIGYGIILLLTRTLYRHNPRARASLLAVPLIIPFASYLLSLFFSLNPHCVLYGGVVGSGTIGKLLLELCNISTAIGKFLTPAFLITASLAVLKAVFSWTTLWKYRAQYGYATPEQYPELLGIVTELSERLQIRVPKVIITPFSFGQSFTCGFTRPEIVLSKGVLDAVDVEELEAIVAHELAHVSRFDSLTNWLTVFLRDVIFFVPVSYWIFNQYTEQKEMAADDLTIELTHKPLAFAQALIKVWKISPRSIWYKVRMDNLSPNPGLVKKGGLLEVRIQRILDGPVAVIGRQPSVAIVVPVVLVVIILGLFYIC